MQKKNENVFQIIAWGILLIFLFMQYQNVYLYYDDYGYCSLSYGYNAGISGTEMNLLDVIRFTKESYFETNGRVFTNFLLVVTAWLGGFELMRVVIPVCILCIYLLIYNMVLPKETYQWKKYALVILLCFSYGMFEVGVCRYGLYWFAAAFGYVVPMLLFLIFCRIYQHGNKFIVFTIAFLLCLSSEQSMAMTIVFIVVHTIFDIIENKKISSRSIITFALSFIAALIMVSSPASRNRMTSEGNIAFANQSIIDKILGNIKIILSIFYNSLGNVFVVFVFSIFLIVAIKLLKRNKKNIVHCIYLICTASVIGLWAGVTFGGVDASILTSNGMFMYFIFAFVEMFIYYMSIDKKKASMILSTGASLVLLLIVPEVPERTFIPFMVMMIFFGADLYSHIENKYVNLLLIGVSIPYIGYCALNMKSIYDGYQKNAIVMEYNHSQLLEASDKIKNNIPLEPIKLYKLIDPNYGGQQAYDLSTQFMKFWMDEYYSLPFENIYIYYDYPTEENPVVVDIIYD